MTASPATPTIDLRRATLADVRALGAGEGQEHPDPDGAAGQDGHAADDGPGRHPQQRHRDLRPDGHGRTWELQTFGCDKKDKMH